jgi:hypothetical protein
MIAASDARRPSLCYHALGGTMAPKHAWAALLTSKCSGKTLNLRAVYVPKLKPNFRVARCTERYTYEHPALKKSRRLLSSTMTSISCGTRRHLSSETAGHTGRRSNRRAVLYRLRSPHSVRVQIRRGSGGGGGRVASLLQAAGQSQLHYESTPRRKRGNLPLFAGSAEERSASAGG